MIIERFENEKLSLTLEENMVAKFAFLANAAHDMEVNKTDITIINSHRKTDMFNIICNAKTSNPDVLQEAIESFEREKFPFAWWVGFRNEPPDLTAQLEKLHLICTENELGMAINLAELPFKPSYPELKILQVDDNSKLDDFINMLTELVPYDALAIKGFYETSRAYILKNTHILQLYLGYFNDKPVASSALFCHAGVAGIWDIITLPGARRKGIGTDMTLHALNEGKKLGYALGVLTASDEGRLVYQKLGFTPLQQFYVYNLQAD